MYTDPTSESIWVDIQKILKQRGPLKIRQLSFFYKKKQGLKLKKWEQQAVDAGWSPPSRHPLEVSDKPFSKIVHEQMSRNNLILTASWKLRLKDEN